MAFGKASEMRLNETLSQLMALQSLDAQIEQLAGDRDALRVDVEQQRQLVQQLAQRREEIRRTRQEEQRQADSLELKIKEREQENARLQIQLNTTKRQAEYDAIRNSLMSHRADISKWEDEELELLERVDRLRREEAELQSRAAAEQQNLRALEEAVARQSADYDRRIDELSERRERLRESIDPKALESYERLKRSRGTTAIALVKGRVCRGCFTSVSKQIENDLLRGTEVVYCQSCGRMLMLDEEGDYPSP